MQSSIGLANSMQDYKHTTRFPLLMMLTLSSAFALVGYPASFGENGVKSLFDGEDLTDWRESKGDWAVVKKVSLEPSDSTKFSLSPGTGVLVNGPKGRTVNLISQFEHGDVEAHIEFMVPKNSNSGVYFQGRYEIQILDSWGVRKPEYSDCGGVYHRWMNGKGVGGNGPRINASRPPGEWQTFEVVFRAPRFDSSGKKVENARFVKVVHNSQVIHEDVELLGSTRAAVYENDEKPAGPLMLQGDHGPVVYRNIWLKPIVVE